MFLNLFRPAALYKVNTLVRTKGDGYFFITRRRRRRPFGEHDREKKWHYTGVLFAAGQRKITLLSFQDGVWENDIVKALGIGES